VLKYIYIIGGGEGPVYYNVVFVLDTVTRQWTSGNISTMTPARLKYIYKNVRKRVQLYSFIVTRQWTSGNISTVIPAPLKYIYKCSQKSTTVLL
jgi:hypothetical protein